MSLAARRKLATITGMTVAFNQDPYVSLGFAVTAYVDTTVSITATIPVIPSLTTPQAFASAGVGMISDGSGTATLTGSFANNKVYEVRSNVGVFADLLSGFGVPADDGASYSDRNPASGLVLIGGSVSSITGAFSFGLTAGEEVNGTSNFTVVPEPATIILLTVGGFGLLRRKR